MARREAGELQEHFQWLSEEASSALSGEELARSARSGRRLHLPGAPRRQAGIDLLQAAAAKLSQRPTLSGRSVGQRPQVSEFKAG